jgi:hypothetical protein
MTEDTVEISITIRVSKREVKIERRAKIEELEESIQGIIIETGQQTLGMGILEIDERMAKRVPQGWRNVGTEERWMVSSVGAIRYKRRVYLDENKQRRKPMDEILGIERYGRVSERVQEMGASLACMGTYRLAADQLSWLIKTPISHSSVQRMVWETGNRIADGEEAERRRIFEHGGQVEAGRVEAPVLYGESDGVWVHLQREKKRSAEVRVAIMSTGRKLIEKDRYRLENKHCLTAIGLNSEMWKEQIVREAHLFYDLNQTKMLICGGDGNQWVRHSFDRMGIHQEFVLDRFHLHRAARRAFQDRTEANRMVKKLRREGFAAVSSELIQKIDQAEGRKKELLKDFYQYVHNNQDGVLDLEYREYAHPACLGAIEANVDKLVVHRMKGRGCSWRLRGLRAMLALCRNCDQLRCHAYRYLPTQTPKKISHRLQKLEVKYAEGLQKSMPIFFGPDQDKPWVRSLYRHIHGRFSLFCNSRGI